MAIVPLMWTVWGLLAAITAAVYAYRLRLERDEEDQIFLCDGFEHEKIAQSAIVAKVNKIQPILRVCEWLVGAATVFVLAYYAMDVFNQFK
jgi:hypothetical protein